MTEATDSAAHVRTVIRPRSQAGVVPDRTATAVSDLVGALGAGVVLHDVAGRLLQLDHAAATALGVQSEDTLGRTWHDPAWQAVQLDGRPMAGHQHPVMLTLADGATRHGAVVGLGDPAAVRWVRFDVAALLDGSVAALVTDVTDDVQRGLDRATEYVRTRGLLAPERDVVVTVSRHGRIVSANTATQDVLGRSPADLLGCSLVELVTPADRPGVRDAFDSLAADATAVLRVRVRRRGGERRWARLGIRWLDPDMGAAHVVLADEHEAVSATGRAAELAQQLGSVAAVARDTIALHSAEGTFTWVSERASTDLGWEPEDLIGRSLHELVHAGDVEQVDAAHGRAAAGDVATVRFRCRGADDEWHLVECRLTGVLDRATGRLLELRSATRAATEILRSEERLQAAEALFERSFDSSPGAMALLRRDETGRCVWHRLNDALVTLLGRARGSLLRLSPADVIHEPVQDGTTREDALAAFEAMFGGVRDAWRGRLGWVRGDGSGLDADVTAVAVQTGQAASWSILLHIVPVGAGSAAVPSRPGSGADELTSLPDRALLLDRLVNALQRATRSGQSVGVAVVSLDGLTDLVHVHGQAAGDSVVVEVVGRLMATLRAGDTLARVADDAFLVLCEDAHELALSRVAARLSSAVAIAAPGTPSGQVGASVGCATRPCAGGQDPSRVADELVAAAEAAAREVRRRGGGWQFVKHTFA